jgi:hypothetical protein
LLALGLAGRTRPVGKDKRVAQHVVAQLREADAEMLLKELIDLDELPHFGPLQEGLAQRCGPDVLVKRRGEDASRVAAEVLDEQAESDVFGNESQQPVARCGSLGG